MSRENMLPDPEWSDVEDYRPNVKNVDADVDEPCFVATAVYEDANAQQLDVLRHYRDNVLGNNVAGRAFVSFYYSGVGKTVANIVKKHARFAIPSIKKGLDGLIDRHARDLISV